MQSPNYYDLLEVWPGASAVAIEAAYQSLRKKYHPDTNPDAGAVEHFERIQEAWEVLSDPGRRRAYDEQAVVGQGGLWDSGDSRMAPQQSDHTTANRDNLVPAGDQDGPATKSRTAIFSLAGCIVLAVAILMFNREPQLNTLIGSTAVEAAVVRIIDGDSLVLSFADGDQKEIRLFGIDAPEAKQPFGPQATQLLSDLVEGGTVTVV